MIAGMAPARQPGLWHFCTLPPGDARRADAAAQALAQMIEPEGLSLVLAEDAAARLGFDTAMPMAQIVLQVHSALDGVGLTAAVSATLAGAGIPCNIIAGYHHDHLFVPAAMADEALRLLADRAAQ